VTEASVHRELGEAAWAWVLRQVRMDDDGPWLPDAVRPDVLPVPDGEDRDSLYAGIAGLAPVLAELRSGRAWTAVEQQLADGIVDRLAREATTRVEASLYGGLGGDATALRLLAPGQETVALKRLAELAAPGGWPSIHEYLPGREPIWSDLVMGTAGVVLAAAWCGGQTGLAVAATGAQALQRIAIRTGGGLDWEMYPGVEGRCPNYSHGTAGVATALAVAGHLLDRDDLVGCAAEGAAHLLTLGSLADGGFVVPHTIPPSSREVEPLTYTWCHGPTGTSHLFSALALAGVPEVSGHPVTELRARCWRSVLGSGVPERLRPGFWDNDGRCCGTAGVGDALLDAAQDAAAHSPDDAARLLDAARRMAAALVERAVRDRDGARWQFVEHRQDPPLLPPSTSWMQGAAGIACFLLRLARVLDTGVDTDVVDRPDQWWSVPAALRRPGPGAAPGS
jgi:hypothetical protein